MTQKYRDVAPLRAFMLIQGAREMLAKTGKPSGLKRTTRTCTRM